ncbi:hypothetical protein C8Q72DRAFT_878316 [Fomitopsis betulina]|nr:hypothetical protein C8Q72DRAFT_878316 [Fomitopsis betulina]
MSQPSDSIIASSPIQTTEDLRRKQRKVREAAKQAHETARHEVRRERVKDVCQNVLSILKENNIPFGELLEFVSDPANQRGNDQYRGLFSDVDWVHRILDFWMSSSNSVTARNTIQEWALCLVSHLIDCEACAATQDGFLRTQKRPIDESFALHFSIEAINAELTEHCLSMLQLLDAFSCTAKQHQMDTKGWQTHRLNYLMVCMLITLSAHSQKNNYTHIIFGLYAYALGAQCQLIELLAPRNEQIRLNNSAVTAMRELRTETDVDHDNGEPAVTKSQKKCVVIGVLKRLSDACKQAACINASTRVLGFVYDNINMLFHLAEQHIGHKTTQQNGTCATVFGLYDTGPEDMLTINYVHSFVQAPRLALHHILPSSSETNTFDDLMCHTVLSIIVNYGGPTFERFKSAASPFAITTPVDHRIPLHKTDIFPLPAMNIDESTIVGNAEVVERMFSDVGLDLMAMDFTRMVKLIAGDHLSINRIRSLTRNCAGHDSFTYSFMWAVTTPGFFHYKMNATHGFMETHYGRNTSLSNPGSLAFHNNLLDRKPVVLTSLPGFRECCDLIFMSLYAHVLHRVELVFGCNNLEEYAETVTLERLQDDCAKIVHCYADSKQVDLLCTARWNTEASCAGDMVFVNTVLFMRDALLLRLLTDVIKCGNSGRLVLLLKPLALFYRGTGHSNYMQELLYLLHNLTNVWPEPLRRTIMNNWLVNPTSKANSWVEVDLMQKHLSIWIKTVYKAHGSNQSWEWLAMISLCIDVLRCLASHINISLGALQGTKHATPSLDKDIRQLVKSLHSHHIYKYQPGRTTDNGTGQSAVVRDSITYGLQQLGGPLKEFNVAFERLQSQCENTPLLGEKYTSVAAPQVPDAIAPAADGDMLHPGPPTAEGELGHPHDAPSECSLSSNDGVSDVDSDGSGVESSKDEGKAEDLDSPTCFSLDTAEDVALDMDGDIDY